MNGDHSRISPFSWFRTYANHRQRDSHHHQIPLTTQLQLHWLQTPQFITSSIKQWPSRELVTFKTFSLQMSPPSLKSHESDAGHCSHAPPSTLFSLSEWHRPSSFRFPLALLCIPSCPCLIVSSDLWDLIWSYHVVKAQTCQGCLSPAPGTPALAQSHTQVHTQFPGRWPTAPLGKAGRGGGIESAHLLQAPQKQEYFPFSGLDIHISFSLDFRKRTLFPLHLTFGSTLASASMGSGEAGGAPDAEPRGRSTMWG